MCVLTDLKRASPVVSELTTGGLLLNSTRRMPHGGGTSVSSLSAHEDDPRIVGGKLISPAPVAYNYLFCIGSSVFICIFF